MNASAGNLVQMEPQTLWRAWRDRRESAAFEALVRPQLAWARDLARRMGARPDEADDLVQESLVQLAREPSDDPLRYGLRAWIGRRLVLKVRMHMRASGRRRRHERAVPGPRPVRDTFEARDEVQAALARLGRDDRQAVMLRFLYDLDYPEIAYVLKVSEGACRLRVHRALKRLRTLLGARAPAALIAALGIQATADASLVKGALVASTSVAKKAIVVSKAHAAAAATVLSVAVTTAVLTKPEPAPAPPPATVAAKPAPPPSAPAAPTGLDLLADHLAGRADLTAAFWDFARVAAAVQAASGPPVRFEARGAVTTVDLPRTGVVEFGPGRFEVRGTVRPGAQLTLRGAGRTRTVVRVSLFVQGAAEHLRVSDLTLEGVALDVRGGAAAVFERVGFRGWVTRAGYSAPVGVAGRAYLGFSECVFLGGYRRPAGGYALSQRREALALFDRCRFVDLEGAVVAHGRSVKGLVHARECEFVNTPAADRAMVCPLRVRGGTVRIGRKADPAGPRRHAWGRFVDDVAGVALLPGAHRVRAADLLRFLDGFKTASGERITGIQALAWEGLAAPWFVVHLIDGADARRRVVVDGRLRPAPRLGELVLPRLPGRDQVYRSPPLIRVVHGAWASVDPTLPASGIVEWQLNGPGNTEIPCICVTDLFGDPLFYVHSRTGRLQPR